MNFGSSFLHQSRGHSDRGSRPNNGNSSNNNNNIAATGRDESHLMILSDKIEADDHGEYRAVLLPSPNCATVGEYYVACRNKMYWVQGIKPNIYPTSMFIDDLLVNWDHILATFEFDVMFIFLSLLYMAPDVFVSMPSRIYKCYRSSTEPGSQLESAMLYLWEQNVDNIVNRMGYICDVVNSPCGTELLYKPNPRVIKAVLGFKVRNLVQYAKEKCILTAGYCHIESSHSQNHVTKHSIWLDEDKCTRYAWGLVTSFLGEATISGIYTSEFLKTLDCIALVQKARVPLATKKPALQPKSKRQKIKGVAPITGFFKAK